MSATAWLAAPLLRVRRVWVQAGAALLTNSYFPAVLKHLPCPSLNCHSCPGAILACPVGSLQHFAADHRFPLYVAGALGLVGLASGRLTCGWLCPFGLLQDLAYRLPTRKWSLRWDARWLPLAALAVLVVALPFATGELWFSKLCPVGTLEAGIPWVLISPEIRRQAGALFAVKLGILGLFLGWMVVTRRPFCRTACPLGAIYSLVNPISAFRVRRDGEACGGCDRCRGVCPVELDPPSQVNSMRCIHCLECVRACPSGALSLSG